MENYKIYVSTDKEEEKIKFTIGFKKEGFNYATYESIVPGYRVTAKPVIIKNHDDGFRTESFTAFSGFADTLIPCSRRSNKRFESAKQELDARLVSYLEWFKERGYKIKLG